MGAFNLFKRNKNNSKKKNNKVSYEFHDYDQLPNDFDALDKIFDYYWNLRNNDQKYDEEIQMIIRKFKEVGDQQIPYDPVNRGRFIYALFNGTTEDMASFHFDEFLEECKKTVVDASVLNHRENNKYISHESLYQATYSKDVENRFQFHDKENLSDEEKEDNVYVEYYENHLNQLVSLVFELIDKQSQGDKLLYTGYYMYMDLLNFFVRADARFSRKVWEKSHDYNVYCCQYYNDYLLLKLKKYKNSYDIVQKRNQIARNNSSQCDEQLLSLMAQNYVPALSVMNIIGKFYFHLTDDQIEQLISEIIKLSHNVRFVTAQINKIASFVCTLALECENEDIVNKMIDYLHTIDQNAIKTSLDKTNHVPQKLKDIEVRKRELHRINNDLPSFVISPIEMEFKGTKTSNIKYYDTNDDRQLIVTGVFVAHNIFKEGDILESIETGERFELASIRTKPDLFEEDFEEEMDEDTLDYLEVQIYCKNKHHFNQSERLVKIK